MKQGGSKSRRETLSYQFLGGRGGGGAIYKNDRVSCCIFSEGDICVLVPTKMWINLWWLSVPFRALWPVILLLLSDKSDGVGVGVGVVSGVVRALMTKWKSKIGVVSPTEWESEKSGRFHFLPTPLTTPLTFSSWSSEKQIVGVRSRSGRISQSECTFPRFVIGLVLLLLLPTPTIWFSLDHKRNVRDGVVSGIGTLFSRDHKLYASDYDSDSDSVAVKTSL